MLSYFIRPVATVTVGDTSFEPLSVTFLIQPLLLPCLNPCIVHSDHLKVYDFSSWVRDHPGNSATRNPILEVAESGGTILTFPDWHEMSRSTNNKDRFVGGSFSLGDEINFYELPPDLLTEELAVALGLDISAPAGGGGSNPLASSEATVVCGSPFETANASELGGSQGSGAFDAATSAFQSTFEDLTLQRQIVWTHAILNDPGQLRQRVAWALSQILVFSPSGIADGDFLTEAFITYYDIFVRNAFGNYRDILKETAFSPMMADMLIFFHMKSTAAAWEEDGILASADENFYREVLQLFSTGLFRLNTDGTRVDGAESVYTNDDIEEYARAWTGFMPQPERGNMETYGLNRVDPMRV